MSYIGTKPTIDTVTPGTNQLTIGFTQTDVGDPVATYYYSLDGSTPLGSGVPNSPLIISDISSNTTFYIIASNSVGDIVSDPSSGTPNYVGSKPTIDTITPGTNQLTIDFTQTDAGSPAATYYYSLDGTTPLGSGTSSSPLSITGISGETTFYIIASNSVGDIVSDSSSGTPNYVGSKPTIDTITPGTNQLTIGFTQTDSGNPTSTYYYSLDGTTPLGSGVSSSPLSITGISGETTFYVVASNSAGNVVSDPSSGTPNYTGSAPVVDSVVSGVNSLSVSFHQDNSGNPLPTYYYSLDGFTPAGTGVSSSPLTISDISNALTFYLVAYNSAGLVSSVSTSNGTPYFRGTAPVIDLVTPGVNSFSVNFHQDNSGNSAPTYYYSFNGTDISGTGVSSSPLTIPNRIATTNFYIVAQNEAGNVVSDVSSGSPLKVNVPCFGENTRILCFNTDTFEEEYMNIKNIRRGTLVKTLRNGYVPVDMIGKTTMVNNFEKNERHKNRLYKCTKREYPEMTNDDLILTGCHCILVDKFKSEEERMKTIEVNRKIYITDNKYRLPACVDKRAQIYERSGDFTIYHFALENDDYYMNYGVYANGLLVETSSKRYMRELSNMELI